MGLRDGRFDGRIDGALEKGGIEGSCEGVNVGLEKGSAEGVIVGKAQRKSADLESFVILAQESIKKAECFLKKRGTIY